MHVELSKLIANTQRYMFYISIKKLCFKILIPILIIILILFQFHDNTNFYQVSLAMSCDLKLTGSLQLQYLRAHYRYASDFSPSQL